MVVNQREPVFINAVGTVIDEPFRSFEVAVGGFGTSVWHLESGLVEVHDPLPAFIIEDVGGLLDEDAYEYQTVKLIKKNKKAICKDIKAMEKLLTKKPEKAQAIADYYHEKILPLMARIRENTDALEKVTDRKIWPMPTYSDLLFGKD